MNFTWPRELQTEVLNFQLSDLPMGAIYLAPTRIPGTAKVSTAHQKKGQSYGKNSDILQSPGGGRAVFVLLIYGRSEKGVIYVFKIVL